MQRIGIALATLLIASCGGIEEGDQQPEQGTLTALGGAPDGTPDLPRIVRIFTDSGETTEDGTVVAVDEEADGTVVAIDEEALLGPLSGDVQTKAFHTRHCPVYRCISCIETFSSIPAALEAGYTPHDCAAQATKAYLE